MTSNIVILVANVGRDPEKNADSAIFTAATSHYDREDNEITLWHRVVAFAKTGENVLKNVVKGDTVYIEGKLNYFKTEDRGVITSIIAHKVMRLHRSAKKDAAPVTETDAAQAPKAA